MSDTDLIGRILARPVVSLSISINEHRGFYESVSYYLDRDPDARINLGTRNRMIETDTIIEIWCYPDTPIGNIKVYHHDLTAALTEMLRILEGK